MCFSKGMKNGIAFLLGEKAVGLTRMSVSTNGRTKL